MFTEPITASVKYRYYFTPFNPEAEKWQYISLFSILVCPLFVCVYLHITYVCQFVVQGQSYMYGGVSGKVGALVAVWMPLILVLYFILLLTVE